MKQSNSYGKKLYIQNKYLTDMDNFYPFSLTIIIIATNV